MQIYKHRQIGTLIVLGVGLTFAGSAMAWILAPSERGGIGWLLVLLASAVFLFGALTVEVTTDELVVSFGPGLIRKRWRIEEIRKARVVRNPWYYGWGIRLTPRRWLFNVSGLDAVEMELNSGRSFRIGTDEPQRLLAAVETARQFTSRRS